MRMRTALLTFVALSATACKGNQDDTGLYEPGCITVDGEGRYRYLADALEVADAGSVIRLCSADVEESVVVSKDVTITGAGSDSTHWFAPTNEPAMVVMGGVSVTVTNLQIISTRNGITVEEGGALVVENMEILGAGSYGIEATRATVTATGLVVEDALWGGIRMDGGTLDLDSSRIDDCVGWGVLLEGGAIGTLSENTLRETFLSDESASEWDGWAVGVKGGSTVDITGGHLDGNVLGAVYAEGLSAVTLDGVDADGNYFGLWMENSTLDVANTSIDMPEQYAILAVAGSTVTLTNVELTANPETSPFEDDTNYLNGGYGILMQAGASLTIADGLISGFNGGGFYVVGTVTENMPVTLTNTVVTDNGGQGGIFQWADLTFTDVTFSDTRNHDELCLESYTWSCNWALAAFQADVTWTGGALTGNGDMGLVMQQGSATMQDLTVSDNEAYGLWLIDSALNIEGASFSGYGDTAIHAQSSVGLLDDVSFSDRDFMYTYTYDTTEYRYFGEATDITAYDSTLVIQNSSFTDGNDAIDVSSSEVTVEDTTFSGYTGYGLDIYGGSLELLRATLDGMGPRSLYCFGSATVDFDTVTINDTVSTTDRQETWTDGVLVGEYEWNNTGPVLYASGCGVDLEDLVIDGAADQVIDFYNTSVEIDGFTVTDVATEQTDDEPAVKIRYTSGTASAWLNEVEITGVANGPAVKVSSYADDTTPSVTLRGLKIGLEDDNAVSGVAGDGVVLDTIAGVTLNEFDIANTGGSGIHATNATAEIDGVGLDPAYTGTITASTAQGLHAEDGALTVKDITVAGAGASGFLFHGGTHDVQDCTITASTTEGLYAEDATLILKNITVADAGASGFLFHGGTHDVQDVNVTSAVRYGMECPTTNPDDPPDVPVFTTCTPGELTATMGDLSGCAACAE
ncbi:MAG: right-handed parallel beta-helix repeat-containing protein [Deltaproteobacteria bacterium]|nr:right-handed parallel beta-helix repeat-containing protein [Deltaproteobacteria bacterium]MBW2252978.1 right-handed parallel beta-helix repeat-containing protein [Deltaproteobacteria bacterium]